MKFNETFEEYMNLYTEGHIGSAMRNLDRISGQQDADKLYGAIHAEVQKGKSVEEVLKDMNYAEKDYKVMVNSYNNWLASKPAGENAEDVPAEKVDEFHKALDELVHKYLGHSSDETEGDAEDNQDDLENRIQDALAAGHIDQSDAREIRRLGEFSEREEDYEENAGLEYYKKMERIAEDILNRYEDPEETPSHAITAALKKVMPNLSEREVVEATQDVFQFMYDLHEELGENGEEDAEGKIDKDRMECNSPRRTSGGSKKFVVKACKDGKEKIVRFGDPNMKIKKSNPKRRKSFRARHKCDQKKDKFSAAYWACKSW